jgi:hypothetical protein
MPRRTDAIIIPLTRAERRRVDVWAHEQEREASQAIRYVLREILALDPKKQTPADQANGAGAAMSTR